jgi:two-component system chemotaxis response regulator CheY
MRILIAEGDFVCRRLLQNLLSIYGQCDIAVSGQEVMQAFKLAHQEDCPYDLLCLDFLLPDNNGLEIWNNIRAYEKKHGVQGQCGVKIIISSVLDHFKDIQTSFQEECETYLAKPITKEKLDETIKQFGLIS